MKQYNLYDDESAQLYKLVVAIVYGMAAGGGGLGQGVRVQCTQYTVQWEEGVL